MAYYKRREVFLMSLEEERKILFPLYYLYFEIRRSHQEEHTAGDQAEIRARERREVAAAFSASKVNIEEAKALAHRLTTQKWYSVYYTGVEDKSEQPPVFTEDSAIYSLITSDNTTEGRPLTFREYGEFYALLDPNAPALPSTIKFWAKARKALQIPKDYVQVNPGALEVLLAVLELGEDSIAPQLKDLPSIFSKKINAVEFPIDKLNNNIWRQPKDQIEGQLTLEIEMGKKGAEAIVVYSIDFDALEKDLHISKQLEPYDKRVYMAVNALYNAGYETMSLTQVYNAMGYEGRPAATDIEKINSSITKMQKAHITVDNVQEVKVHKHAQRFKYDSSLLPCERVQGFINGQLTEGLLHIFREPPAMSFAKAHSQLTTISPALLQSPISKTRSNILLEDYLLDRIAKMKSKTSPDKILLSTLYENAEITTVKQRQRAPEKIAKILTHFKEHGYIKGYKMDKNSIAIKL